MNTGGVDLIVNGTATSAVGQWPGGTGMFSAAGTWGGATISLQFVLPNGTFIAAGTDTTLTADGAGIFTLPPCPIKAVVTGGTPSALFASAHRVPV